MAVIRGVRRGGMAAAMDASSSQEGTALALADLRRDRHAASCRSSRQSLLNTWHRFHAAAHDTLGPIIPLQVLPLTTIGLEHVASYFKAGGYRSFENYLSVIKLSHIEAGHLWTDQLAVMARWTTRSVLRGIGPARQSKAFDLSRVLALERPEAPLVVGGPLWPVHSLLLGSIFLLPEAELSSARVTHLQLDRDKLEVTWSLPASKTDTLALGTSRTWG